MENRIWWVVGIIVVVALVLLAWFVFRPRPLMRAGPMPTSPREKMKRWQEAMKKAMPQPGTPIQPSQRQGK